MCKSIGIRCFSGFFLYVVLMIECLPILSRKNVVERKNQMQLSMCKSIGIRYFSGFFLYMVLMFECLQIVHY